MVENNGLSLPNLWSLKNISRDTREAGIHFRRRYCESAHMLNDNFAINLHWHDHVQIWYTLSGEYVNTIYERSHRLGAGGLMIVPPFVSHDTDGAVDQSVEVISVDVRVELIQRLVPESKQSIFLMPVPHEHAFTSLHLHGQDKARADEFFTRLHSECEKDLNRALVLYHDEFCSFFEFLADAVNVGAEKATPPRSMLNEKNYRTIMQAQQYIIKHFTEPIRLSDMCRVTAMSQAGFCKLFKEYTGNTFTQYLYMLRIPKAANVICATDLPINRIMRDFGFNTKSNFIRLFKTVYGCTPSEMRRRARRR